MKILIVIAASMFGFGLAVQETYRVPQQNEVVVVHAASMEEVEQPAAHVLLDTVEITAVAPAAVALN